MPSPDWSAARAQMHLDPTVTMLNTGSFGPQPKPVFVRANEFRLKLAAGPTDFYLRQVPPAMWHADICSWLAVPAAIDFQAALGWENVRARMAELAAFTRRTIGATGLELAHPHGAMTAFNCPVGSNAPSLRKELWSRRIEIPIIERPDRLLLRVSHHFYTTEAEIAILAEALPAILQPGSATVPVA